MVIDSHTHIREGNEDIGAFLAGMDEAGVDMAVVSPIAPVELGFHDNKYIAKLVKDTLTASSVMRRFTRRI